MVALLLDSFLSNDRSSLPNGHGGSDSLFRHRPLAQH